MNSCAIAERDWERDNEQDKDKYRENIGVGIDPGMVNFFAILEIVLNYLVSRLSVHVHVHRVTGVLAV